MYLAVLFGGRVILSQAPPLKLQGLFFLHNALLSFASLWLLILYLENIVPVIFNKGLFYAICDPKAWTQRLELLYYVNYLFKYWGKITITFRF